MSETTTVHRADKTFLSSTQDQFANAIAKAISSVKNADQPVAHWSAEAVLNPDHHSSPRPMPSTSVAVRLQGDLAGQMILCLAHEGGAQLLSQDAEADPPTLQQKWEELLRASRQEIVHALEPVFGTVTLDSGRDQAPGDERPLAHLRMTQSGTATAAEIILFLDKTLSDSLERLAAANRALPTEGDAPSLLENRERLHRVIDVPLAVTLRFGQRQMTLRELLALSTGSLVELDRQVEEPVELMLGERVVARGEVVIVDGNYGMRVLEVIEGAGTRAAPVSV